MIKTSARILVLALCLGTLARTTIADPARPAGETKPADDKTLFDRLGGVGPISVVVDEFIDRLYANDLLNKNPAVKEARDRVPAPYLKFHVTSLVCQAAGGPCKYVGRDMKSAHARLGITEKEWDEMARLFKAVLDTHKVPAKEQQELFAIVDSTKADIVTAPKPRPARK